MRAMGELAAAAERPGSQAAWAPELYDRSATISVAEMAGPDRALIRSGPRSPTASAAAR